MQPGSRRPAQAGLRSQAPGADIEADIVIEDAGWRRMVPRAATLAARAMKAAGMSGTVVLTSDNRVKRLNARHRGRNKPTNVLTFESGDIVLARGVVRREARAAARCPADHLAHLVVHGALHLRGLDHEAAGAARRMELAEARILHRLRIPNPWKPRCNLTPCYLETPR